MQLENGVWAWGLSPSKYVQEAMRNCKKYIGENLPKFYQLTWLAPNPFPTDYRPELDVSPELPPEHASYYQSLMGIFWWMIELGRIDIPLRSGVIDYQNELITPTVFTCNFAIC